MPLDEAWLKTSYAVRYFYIYQEVTETDLMRWAIRSKEITPPTLKRRHKLLISQVTLVGKNRNLGQ
jgi:hypothetical protein